MQEIQKKFTVSFFRLLFKRSSGQKNDFVHKTALSISPEQRVEVLKALADETRLSIVEKLIREGGTLASCDILACTSVHKLSQPAMSHHFNKLVDAGVIIETKRGTQKLYELNCALLSSVGVDIHNL